MKQILSLVAGASLLLSLSCDNIPVENTASGNLTVTNATPGSITVYYAYETESSGKLTAEQKTSVIGNGLFATIEIQTAIFTEGEITVLYNGLYHTYDIPFNTNDDTITINTSDF